NRPVFSFRAQKTVPATRWSNQIPFYLNGATNPLCTECLQFGLCFLYKREFWNIRFQLFQVEYRHIFVQHSKQKYLSWGALPAWYLCYQKTQCPVKFSFLL